MGSPSRPTARRLYVALAGENAVAVVDLDARGGARLHPDLLVSGRRRGHARRPAARDHQHATTPAPGRTAAARRHSLRRVRRHRTPRPSTSRRMIKGSVQVVDVPALRMGRCEAHTRSGGAQQPARRRAARQKPARARRDQARLLRDQGEPHLRPDLRRPARGQRRPGADALPATTRRPTSASSRVASGSSTTSTPTRRSRPTATTGPRRPTRPTTSTRPGRSTTRRASRGDTRALRLRATRPRIPAELLPSDRACSAPRRADRRLPVGQRVGARRHATADYGEYTGAGDCSDAGVPQRRRTSTHLQPRSAPSPPTYPGLQPGLLGPRATAIPAWEAEFRRVRDATATCPRSTSSGSPATTRAGTTPGAPTPAVLHGRQRPRARPARRRRSRTRATGRTR